ncbi:hypothetical protein B566_EDAN004195 [Ephemera danica]|nr:hypothetical protein B566_EDAN004195 [Ephemera danica]
MHMERYLVIARLATVE